MRPATAGAGMRVAAWLLAAIAIVTAALSPGIAADLMPLTGRVVDRAGLIEPAAEAALTATLEAFEAKSSDQIVVATLASLGGESIEAFANRQFRAWELGQAGENNGVLLLVARDDRKMRIEVGYGLEGTLTDLHSKLIIENTMVPAFRAGDFSGGIARAVDDIILVLEGNAAELEARGERNRQSPADVDWLAVLVVGIWVSVFVGGFLLGMLAPIFGKKLGPNRYRWLGIDVTIGGGSSGGGSSRGSSGWSSGGSSSGSSGGFSGGGGSSGGGGASGGW